MGLGGLHCTNKLLQDNLIQQLLSWIFSFHIKWNLLKSFQTDLHVTLYG